MLTKTALLVWIIALVLSSNTLVGCALNVGSTKVTVQPSNPVTVSNARGFWRAVKGPHIAFTTPVKIYHYDWYAIDTSVIAGTIVVWDNGLNCSRTPGTIQGNEVKLVADDATTTFVIQDAKHATVTFQHAEQTYTKQLEKEKDDPEVLCM